LQLEISWDGKNVTLVSPDPSDHAGMQATFLFFLPPTPIGNNTTWTGTYTKIIIPGAPLLGPFPFSGSFQRTTPLTFIGTMTFTNLPFGDNTSSCNVSMQFSSALTGIVP
jgi:hypothetical protein